MPQCTEEVFKTGEKLKKIIKNWKTLGFGFGFGFFFFSFFFFDIHNFLFQQLNNNNNPSNKQQPFPFLDHSTKLNFFTGGEENWSQSVDLGKILPGITFTFIINSSSIRSITIGKIKPFLIRSSSSATGTTT